MYLQFLLDISLLSEQTLQLSMLIMAVQLHRWIQEWLLIPGHVGPEVRPASLVGVNTLRIVDGCLVEAHLRQVTRVTLRMRHRVCDR